MTPWHPWNKFEIMYCGLQAAPHELPLCTVYLQLQLSPTFPSVLHSEWASVTSSTASCSLSFLGLCIFCSLYITHTSASPPRWLLFILWVSFKRHFFPDSNLCQVHTYVAPCTTLLWAPTHFVVTASLIVSPPGTLGAPRTQEPRLACSSFILSYSAWYVIGT